VTLSSKDLAKHAMANLNRFSVQDNAISGDMGVNKYQWCAIQTVMQPHANRIGKVSIVHADQPVTMV